MRLDVAFLPHEVRDIEHTVCIVVDLVRATTTLTALFDAGCRTVYIARTVDGARKAAADRGALLCGERQGTKVPGFDYGNSPLEFDGLDLSGKEAVLTTTNGTAAVHLVRGAPAVLAGALRNAAAVTESALLAAGSAGHGITVVCAGREGRFALDDSYCAGYLVALLRQAAEPSGLSMTDAAIAAEHLWLAYDDPLTPIHASASGRGLVAVGLGSDLPAVAHLDISQSVPELVQGKASARCPLRLVPDEPGTVG